MVRALLAAGLLLVVIGLGGLYWVVMFTLPTLGPRWLFFFFLVCLGAGLGVPLILVFNQRALATVPDPNALVVREAAGVGVYFALLAWLQLARLLTVGMALLLAIGLIGMEALWRLRERSRQKTPSRSGGRR
ncbi:MAG: hypothetical protein D6803_04025 [Anaerolineae bacterium]|nr:MAG: hypothetical protein D6803_04025 [Anaerolineae bacterium]